MEAEQAAYWLDDPAAHTYVATVDDEVAGVYIVHPNKTGRGSHVGHCAYMVDRKFRGHGLGRKLCEHSLVTAKQLGFVSVQFNLVVSSNIAAVKSWQKCGFDIVGTLPRAYRHKDFGFSRCACDVPLIG